MNLKGRLKAIADMLEKCETLIDVGTDHGYVPIYAILNGICEKAVASDIKQGPANNARKNIEKYNMQERATVRISDGLRNIAYEEIDAIVIAGMGGLLIKQILSDDIEKAKKARQIILQPMTEIYELRKWLSSNGFMIAEESLIREDEKIYCIIKCRYVSQIIRLTELEYIAGPKIIEKKGTIAVSCVKKIINETRTKISGLMNSNNINKSEVIAKETSLLNDLGGLILKMSNVKVADIINAIESFAPLNYAENWDNVGLIAGCESARANKVLLCLDITFDVCKYAWENGVDIIISHHPFIFSPLKKLVESPKTEMIKLILSNKISIYCAHTNLDVSCPGVNSALASVLGIICDSEDIILGRYGKLEQPQKWDDFIFTVKTRLNINMLKVGGVIPETINRAGVFCGAFDGDLSVFKKHNIDVLVTGDVKHHHFIDAQQNGCCIIDAGHFNTERPVLDILKNIIENQFNDVEVEIYSKEKEPFLFC